MDEEFTLCEHKVTGGQALLATGALKFWATKGWKPVPDPTVPTPKRGRKPADDAGDNKETE